MMSSGIAKEKWVSASPSATLSLLGSGAAAMQPEKRSPGGLKQPLYQPTRIGRPACLLPSRYSMDSETVSPGLA